jgi:LacI family transcriptional regulator
MEMMSKKDPLRILFFRRSLCELSCREFVGVSRYAKESNWLLQTIEFDGALDTLRLRQTIDVKELLDFWRPAGCIVECGGEKPKLDVRAFADVPVVFLDVTASSLERDDVLYVASDSASVASAAARELLSLGFDDYAFVPFVSVTEWSRSREEEFARIVRMNGKNIHGFSSGSKKNGPKPRTSGYHMALAEWIVSLPKPCGLFAANDVVAREVVLACHKAGLDVPGEVAVIGVDDNESICENAPVSISSVRSDNEGAGYLAGDLLGAIIAGRKNVQPRKFGSAGIVRRRSTSMHKAVDMRVVKALELIRKNACSGLGAAEAASAMGCSRRLADIRFREATGRTILDEIHKVRLAMVKRLLCRKDIEISSIPSLSGYSSIEDLCRVFKRREGITMREYRDMCQGKLSF